MTEPSIWHAVLALSSLQEASELTLANTAPHHIDAGPTPTHEAEKDIRFALKHYNQAVSLLATTMGTVQQPRKVLVCCLIFI